MKNFLFGAMTKPRLSLLAAGLIILGTLSQAADAQGILRTNLIVNGNANAEAGAAGVNVPPGWTGTTGVNVGSYGVTGSYLLTEPAPPDHGFQYFASSCRHRVRRAAPCPILPAVTIGGVSAKVTFAGIVEAGLFRFNVVVPSAGSGDKALLASIGGMTTPASVLLSLQ